MPRDPQAELTRALAGEEPALTELVQTLRPVVHARVARRLLRYTGTTLDEIRQQVEDLTQEVFLTLFADGARILRGWDPERGLSLRNYVGYVAERQVVTILRTAQRNPWTEDPTLTEDLDDRDPGAGPEEAMASRDVLQRLLRHLEERLSPLGRHLFDLLYLRERSVAEVGNETGLSSDAVYAWRSRLRRLARQILTELRAADGSTAKGLRGMPYQGGTP